MFFEALFYTCDLETKIKKKTKKERKEKKRKERGEEDRKKGKLKAFCTALL